MIVKTSIRFLSKENSQGVVNTTDVILMALDAAKTTYTAPVPPLATVQTANDALRVAIQERASAGGGRQLTAVVHARRAEVESLVRQLANYVTATADGNLETLLLSGFPIQKPTHHPVGQLTAPDAPVVRQGAASGWLKARTRPVAGGQVYNWRVARNAAPTVYVQTAQTTGARNTFKGLTPGEIYDVQVNVVGADGPSDWSDDGTMMVI